MSFRASQFAHGDNIPVDSLSSRIGLVYVMKTAPDPRYNYGYPLYAKIRIIKFIVVDSAQHQIRMIFLWVYNDARVKDLHSSGLDTFHLDTIPTYVRPPECLTNNTFRSSTNHYLFTTASSKFTLPQSLLNANMLVTVYDLSGRTLCRLVPGNAGTIDLRRMGAAGKVFLVRVEN